MGQWLHANGPRAHSPFVPVDCAALDEGAQWAGLHGHESGAIRGGFAESPGWFELAQGGTLFLDDWQALAPRVQAALLQAWHTRCVCRLGSSRRLPINVRLVLTTSGAEREGLSGGQAPGMASLIQGRVVNMPGLRDRPADILPLARRFLAAQAQHLKQPLPDLTPDAEQALLLHPWPGHLRELEAVVQRALMRAGGGSIGASQLGLPAATEAVDASTEDIGEQLLSQLDQLLAKLGEAFPGRLHDVVERGLFTHAHRRSNGHQIRAAQWLGVSRNVLRGRLIALGEIDALK